MFRYSIAAQNDAVAVDLQQRTCGVSGAWLSMLQWRLQ
jgi:hypothetical protein